MVASPIARESRPIAPNVLRAVIWPEALNSHTGALPSYTKNVFWPASFAFHARRPSASQPHAR